MIAPNLIHVSKERIQVELTKLLLSNHPDEIRKVFDRELDTRICADFPKINRRRSPLIRDFLKKNICVGLPFCAIRHRRRLWRSSAS